MATLPQLTPHLMFPNGKAEGAMNYYVDLFGGETILLLHYSEDAPEELQGKVQITTFSIAGQQINIMDSSVQHEFNFTLSMSLFFNCEYKSSSTGSTTNWSPTAKP